MNIEFLNLQRQYLSIKEEIDLTISNVVKKQFFILGEELTFFEKEFSAYIGTKYACGVNSGTDALIFSLRALKIGKGDEVIIPALTFIATAIAVSEVGAVPVLVDIDPDTYQIDVEKIEDKITAKTKAIIPVHLYGCPSNMKALKKITLKYNLRIIEDACQAHGSSIKKRRVGNFGDVSAFSFYPGKNLGAYGDGGIVCTNNLQIYKEICRLRNYGQKKKYYHDTIGVNSRLDEIQAAILRIKLKYLDMWNMKRNKIADFYKDNIKGYKFQKIVNTNISNYHLFVIESEQREYLMNYLTKKAIASLIHYPLPVHRQKCYSFLKHKKGDFPQAELISKKILSLPMYPELKEEEVSFIVRKINKFSR